MAGGELEVVVAHYREELGWLSGGALVECVRLYHKGGTGTDGRFPSARQSTLPNVGRESHTYLTHIVNNYDGLADVTVFTQGHLADHVAPGEDPADHLAELAAAAQARDGSTFTALLPLVGVRWWRFRKWEGKRTMPAPCDFRQFCRSVVGLDCDAARLLRWTPGAIVAATRTSIRRRPRAFYARLLGFVEGPGDPEIGHFLERLWFYVLDASQVRTRSVRRRDGTLWQSLAQFAGHLGANLARRLQPARARKRPRLPIKARAANARLV